MQKRTKKITAMKKMADEDLGAAKILRNSRRSNREDFVRFACVLARVTIFFNAGTTAIPTVKREGTDY